MRNNAFRFEVWYFEVKIADNFIVANSDRKSTRLNSSHMSISYAVFCLKKKTMYRGRLWTMRQYAGFGTAAETNRRFRMLLDAGQTRLSVAFDLPTQMGLDSDSSRALGEVGRVGAAIDTVEDMHALLDGIPLDTVSTSMTINAFFFNDPATTEIYTLSLHDALPI